jgi:type II secretory pathway pseudopilin PulG
MRICSVQTRADRPLQHARAAWPLQDVCAKAFTLVELLVVMTFLSLLVVMAQVSLSGALRRQTFQAQVQDFIGAMRMAASHAAESGQRYEIIINFVEQSYLLRKLTGSDLTAEPLAEETITEGSFRGNCRVAYVEFDDSTYTNEYKAKFRAGRAGWQYGGKIVFRDEDDRRYAVVVQRAIPIVQLLEGDPPLMAPRTKEQVPFL